jgi:hypothetical protein
MSFTFAGDLAAFSHADRKLEVRSSVKIPDKVRKTVNKASLIARSARHSAVVVQLQFIACFRHAEIKHSSIPENKSARSPY